MSADARGSDAKTFSISIIIGIFVVGVVSFAAFIVLSAFADDLREPDDGGPHALSKSAVGFAGMVSLLEGDSRHVRISRGPLSEADARNGIIILTPTGGEAIPAMKLRGSWGRVLIVLPKWAAWPDYRHPGWVRSDGVSKGGFTERVLTELSKHVTVGRATGLSEVSLMAKDGSSFSAGRIDQLQTLAGRGISPLLTDAEGHTVLGFLRPPEMPDIQPVVPTPTPAEDYEASAEPEADTGAAATDVEDADPLEALSFGSHGPIYVLSEPDLLNTKGLASAVTARAGLKALGMVSPAGEPIVFDMTLHGLERSRNFLKLMFEPPFLPAVLCLAFSAGLIAINAFAGTLRAKSGREIALGKTMLVENSALLVSLAGRDTAMGKRYVTMTRNLAAAAVGVPPRSSEAQQVAMLDAATRHAGGDQPSFSMLATETTGATTAAALLRAANRLCRWRQETGREHRRR